MKPIAVLLVSWLVAIAAPVLVSSCGGGGSGGGNEPISLAEMAPVPTPESTPDPIPDPVPDPTPESAALRWEIIPDSAMDTVYNKAVDYDPFADLANQPWERIQIAWSGAEVSGDKIYIHGGGHAASPHNGVLAMDAAGNWTRVTEPSPVWRDEDCPDGICVPPFGPECERIDCTVMPDGNPVSVHTYSLLASDGKYLYRSGGSIWFRGSAGVGPKNWKLDLETGEWSTWPESGGEGNHGSLVYHDGRLYLSSNRDARVFDIASGQWLPRQAGRVKFGGSTTIVYGGGYLWAIGDGEAWKIRPEDYPVGWESLPAISAVDAYSPGVVFHEDKLWVWTGGSSLSVFDHAIGQWSTLIPAGNPGPALKNGTYRRLNVLGGDIILINGTDKNAFRLVEDASAHAQVEPTDSGNCELYSGGPMIVPDPRGSEWGHSIRVGTAIGASPSATMSSCADVVGVACQEVDPNLMDGLPRAIDALPDAGGVIIVSPGTHVVTQSYSHRRPFQLLHVQGVPDACGNRPIIRSALTFATKDENDLWQRPDVEPRTLISFARTSKNLILENLEIQNFSAACISIDNSARPGGLDQTVLIKNSFIHHCYSQAVSMSKGPLQDRQGRLYVIDSELGYIWSGNHLLYFAGGESFYTRNSFYHTPGWHALKVVSHNVAVLDSVLSQVGLDGDPMPQVGAINEGVRIGQGSPGSFVACQRGVFQRNTIMTLEQTAGVTRQPRKAIDGCDFEGSYYPLSSGEWPSDRLELEYPSAPTQFWDRAFWDEVVSAGLSYPQASDNEHLLPIYWMDNRFVYLGDSVVRQAVTNSSTYPLTSKGLPHELVPENWIERSRDVFVNNELVNYDYPVGLHKFDSRAEGIKEMYGNAVLVEIGGNNGESVAVPDWFVTAPQVIHSSLRDIEVKDLYPTIEE